MKIAKANTVADNIKRILIPISLTTILALTSCFKTTTQIYKGEVIKTEYHVWRCYTQSENYRPTFNITLKTENEEIPINFTCPEDYSTDNCEDIQDRVKPYNTNEYQATEIKQGQKLELKITEGSSFLPISPCKNIEYKILK